MGLPNIGRKMRTVSALLSGAEREARRDGTALPGPEHLLVSAADLADGTAARALGRFGVDTGALRAAIEQVHAAALADIGIEVHPPVGGSAGAGWSGPAAGLFRLTPQAQQVFQDAVTFAKAAEPSLLLGAHVVAAVCALEHGTAARVLTALGLDRSQLRAAALNEAGTAR
jgi:ATP-dependent Clp protease ATP-binding subunit ClpA